MDNVEVENVIGSVEDVIREYRWAQSAMDRWIDTDTIDRYYRSIPLVMLTTDSIDPSVKDFFFLINSIGH
jgi:hypothetical protein